MAPLSAYTPAQPGSGNLIVHPDLPELTRLYGYSSNTVWTEPQYRIWRQNPDAAIEESHEGQEHVPGKGAAIGFLVSSGYAICWGNPLCPVHDYRSVAEAFIQWTARHNMKPLWSCIDIEMEKVLTQPPYSWTAVSCVKEDVVDPTLSHDMSTLDKRVRNKIYKAERAGLHIWEESQHLPEPKWQQQAEEGMRAWQAHRKGLQIHVTDLQPWRDVQHRRYFYGKARPADSPEGTEEKLVGMVVLAQVHDGWVVKWALEFPDCPKGTSESIIMHVLEVLNKEGSHSLTFGVAGTELKAVDNIKGWKIQTLAATYNGISSAFHLGNKSDFRAKFGGHEDRVYIAYPVDSLGMKGIDAIISVLKMDTHDEKGEGEGGDRLQTPAVERTNPISA
ncbi:hypothetical protein BCV69DRAFT_270560 [Microstroma glucosiphilum]|uniref:Phosphatidylglycerol lysyltransferase C-terminal domain-containing protein n=1 Tax=Pseudomicrostroma glucosiphilum TaxID=1684307 RepID=A0A316U6I7_9BASI|nr:hypothetical protein BCV69DRAFT_270560 [Pseudomicrostroma glucosiphilum]PWN20839.1 hypothetical protein BCV69DRAFT_270560 [Pseudomicrostroma glucosiphilum]